MKTLLSKEFNEGRRISLEWEPQDCWIGFYHARRGPNTKCIQHVWICLLPCLPIHIAWDCSISAVLSTRRELDTAFGTSFKPDRQWAKRYIELSRNDET